MKEKILKTIIIVGMILSITIAHVLVLASEAISYAFQDMGKENVQFKSYFQTEEGKTQEIEEPINSQDIKLQVEVEVKNQGYLSGKIELENNNFKFKQEQIEGIEKITDREITLKQINSKEKVKFQIGLEVNLGNKIDLNTFNQENKITLKGSYNNGSNEQTRINQEQSFKVILSAPKTEEGKDKSQLDAQIITNKIYEIEGQNKRIVQLKLKSGLEENDYPIKETNLRLEAPKGVQKVQVLDRGTLATNGNEEGKNTKETLQRKANQENLTIKIANQEKEGKISYEKQSKDTIIVTYVYPEEENLKDQEIKVTSNITLYDNQQTNIEKQVTTKIEEEKENIIDYKIINQAELYKGKIYANEEQDYKTMSKLDIRYPRNRKPHCITRRSQQLPKSVPNKPGTSGDVPNKPGTSGDGS